MCTSTANIRLALGGSYDLGEIQRLPRRGFSVNVLRRAHPNSLRANATRLRAPTPGVRLQYHLAPNLICASPAVRCRRPNWTVWTPPNYYRHAIRFTRSIRPSGLQGRRADSDSTMSSKQLEIMVGSLVFPKDAFASRFICVGFGASSAVHLCASHGS